MAKKNQNVIVKLSVPIERADKITSEITLTRPDSGQLRGAKLIDLLQMDVDAVAAVVERISEPMIDKLTFYRMDPVDVTNVSMEVVGFLTGKTAESQTT